MRRLLTIVLLGAVLLMTVTAFAASFDALLGAAYAVGLRGLPAFAYAGVPDLASLVAILALMVLRHDAFARKVATATLAIFGVSSALLNVAAALGVISHGMHAAPHHVPTVLAVVIAAVPVVAISLGADLTMRVLASLWPTVEAVTLTPRSVKSRRVQTAAPVMTESVTVETSATESGTESAESEIPVAPSLPEELVDRARTFARDSLREERRVTRETIRTGLGVGSARAKALLDIIRAEGLAA